MYMCMLYTNPPPMPPPPTSSASPFPTPLPHNPQVPLRGMFFWAMIIGTLLGSTQLLLVTGANRALGLSDELFVLGDSVILTVLGQVGWSNVRIRIQLYMYIYCVYLLGWHFLSFHSYVCA